MGGDAYHFLDDMVVQRFLDELPVMIEDATSKVSSERASQVEDLIDGWGSAHVFPAEILEHLEATLDRGSRSTEEALEEEIQKLKRKREQESEMAEQQKQQQQQNTTLQQQQQQAMDVMLQVQAQHAAQQQTQQGVSSTTAGSMMPGMSAWPATSFPTGGAVAKIPVSPYVIPPVGSASNERLNPNNIPVGLLSELTRSGPSYTPILMCDIPLSAPPRQYPTEKIERALQRFMRVGGDASDDDESEPLFRDKKRPLSPTSAASMPLYASNVQSRDAMQRARYDASDGSGAFGGRQVERTGIGFGGPSGGPFTAGLGAGFPFPGQPSFPGTPDASYHQFRQSQGGPFQQQQGR